MVGACKRSRSVIRESEGDFAPKSTSSVFQQVDSSPVQSPDAKRPKGKRKVEEVGVLRRAICFESNEGTAATECKVDVVEIVDSNDESISSNESETTSGDESDIEDGQEDSEQESNKYYEGDKRIPYYEKGRGSVYSTLFDILMRVKEPVCTEVPLQVMENASFLVDLDYISVDRNVRGDILDLKITRQKRNDAEFIMVVKHYHHHDKEAKYHKRLSFLYVSKWQRHRLVLLQYYYEEEEVQLKLKQHGNSKNSNEPYVRTRPSAIQELKETVSSRKWQPREVFFESVRRKDGLEFCRSKSELPRNAKQVSNALASSATSFEPSIHQSRDILLEATEKCKSKDGFVREVDGAPEPVAFLATDRQLKDIELYCAQEGSFSILGVDATLNFSVTPTTYRPLKIYTVRTGKPPVFLGPLLVHQSKTEQTYRYLGSAMKRFNPHTGQLKAFGTDGERAL